MINRELLSILWQRYKTYLILMFICVLGFALMNSQTGVKNWQTEYHNEKMAKESFKSEINYSKSDTSPEQKHPGEVMLYHGEAKPATYTKDFKEYRDHQLEFYLTSQMYYEVGNGYIYFMQNITIYVISAVIVGFFTFFLDYKTGFNTLLFSSRFKRRDIVKTKLGLIGGSFFITVLLAKLASLFNLWWQIPTDYFKVDVGGVLLAILVSSLVTVSIYLISCLTGIILAEWVTGILTVSLFWLSLLFFDGAIGELIAVIRYELLSEPLDKVLSHPNFLTSIVDSYQGYQVSWQLLLLSLVVSVIVLSLSFTLFKKQDLAHNGEYLAFDFLRKPILIIVVTYITFTISVTGISRYMYLNYVTFSPAYFCAKLVISFIVSSIFAKLVIYRQLKISNHFFN